MCPDPILIEPEDGDLFADHYPHKVYKRERWFEDWVEVPYLYANWVYQGTGAAPSQAELVWKFGEGMQPDKTNYSAYEKQDLLNHYIKIEIEQAEGEDALLWYGYLTEQATDRGGAFLREDARVLMGEQAFLVEGLECHLRRTILETSTVQVFGGAGAGLEKVVRRALRFNDPHQFGNWGNRTAAKGVEDAYLFESDLSSATSWTSLQIIEYLFAYHSPRAIDDEVYVTWKLSDDAKDMLPDWDQPVVVAHGRSLWSIITQLCDPRRLLSCRVLVNDEDEIVLDVFSFNEDEIELPSGGVQAANPNTRELDFDRAVDVQVANLRDSARHVIEQIRVRGARKRTICTLSALDSTLVADWAAVDQAAYNTGPAVAGLDVDKAAWRRHIFRGSDTFERVYSWFRLPYDWDGYVANGLGGAFDKAFPDDEARDDEEQEYYIPDLRFSRDLSPEFYAAEAPTASPLDGPRSIVMLLTDYPDSGRYQNVEELGRTDDIERAGNEAGLLWSASVAMQTQAPGIILRVSGAPRHMIASADFVVQAGDVAAELNWRNNLLATVMMELDNCVEVMYPPVDEVLGQPHDVARILTIDVGNVARLDYVAPGTIDRHADGIPSVSPHAGDYCRDDREWMEDVAEFCWEWYGIKRQAFRFTFRQISGILETGQLITKIGSAETEEEVNSVVTGVRWDLLSGGTDVTTAFAEIDPVQLVATPGTAVPHTGLNRGSFSEGRPLPQDV